MKVVVVGYGIQGKKRARIARKDFVAKVDPELKNCKKSLKEIPDDKYDTVILSVPDNKKFDLIQYALKKNKHVMVEKPLIFDDLKLFDKVEKEANKKNLFIYTCYNHRFEPHIVSLKKLLASNKFDKPYYCKFFYGNGTAKLVKKSKWRDNKKAGVIEDLGSHLIDIIYFLFDQKIVNAKLIKISKFENNSPDHSLFTLNLANKMFVECEVSLCSWKNTFLCDLYTKKGSIHINNLCKWGPSSLIIRKRVYPSGKPKEKIKTLKMPDTTWLKEYNYFKKQIRINQNTNLKNDYRIQKLFTEMLGNAK